MRPARRPTHRPSPKTTRTLRSPKPNRTHSPTPKPKPRSPRPRAPLTPSPAGASNLNEMLKTAGLPSFAKLSIDADSNQVVLMGNIGLLQRIEVLLDALDRPGTTSLSTETYQLKNANADLIAQNIRDLFSANA